MSELNTKTYLKYIVERSFDEINWTECTFSTVSEKIALVNLHKSSAGYFITTGNKPHLRIRTVEITEKDLNIETVTL